LPRRCFSFSSLLGQLRLLGSSSRFRQRSFWLNYVICRPNNTERLGAGIFSRHTRHARPHSVLRRRLAEYVRGKAAQGYSAIHQRSELISNSSGCRLVVLSISRSNRNLSFRRVSEITAESRLTACGVKPFFCALMNRKSAKRESENEWQMQQDTARVCDKSAANEKAKENANKSSPRTSFSLVAASRSSRQQC
jgi:hypothetical protein